MFLLRSKRKQDRAEQGHAHSLSPKFGNSIKFEIGLNMDHSAIGQG